MEPEGTFENKLGWFIRQRGLTQEDVAEVVGVSRSAISYYVSGRVAIPATPKNNVRSKLAAYFGVSEEEICPLVLPPERLELSLPGGQRTPETIPVSSPVENSLQWIGFEHKLRYILHLIDLFKGRAAYSDQLYMAIAQEVYLMDAILSSSTPDYQVNRRKFLTTIGTIAFAPTLLVAIQSHPKSSLVEEFLPLCSAKLAVCRQLIRGVDFWTVSQFLDEFLGTLERVAQTPSRYQQAASGLTAEAYRFKAMLAGHQSDFPYIARIDYYKKAAQYSEILPEKDLHTVMLMKTALTYSYYLRDPEQAMIYLQQALPFEKHIASIIRSELHGNIGFVFAQQGQAENTFKAFETAHAAHPGQTPQVSLVGGGVPQLKGWALMELYRTSGNLSFVKQALSSYNAVDSLQFSERGKVQLVNNMAQVALELGDMDMFDEFFQKGLHGSQLLASPSRHKEVESNLLLAQQKWANEPKLQEWKEQFLLAHP